MIGKIIYTLKRNTAVKDRLKLLIALLYFPVIISAYIFSKIKGNKGDLWLISEMGIDAKDNGRDFFEYIRINHPEIQTAFILKKTALEYKNISSIGPVIEPGSFEHFVTVFRSNFLISTHDHYVLPMKWVNWREFKELYGWMVPDLKFVFLQHGVEQWNAEKNSNYNRTKFDYFVTSTQSEFEEVSKYGYPFGNVIKTGLPRFDKLNSADNKLLRDRERIILFSPTWRQYLANVSDKEFLSSNYFKTVNSTLNNEKVLELLDKYSIDLLFMPPHHEIQKYLHEFSAGSDRVKLISIDDHSLKEVLKDSSLILTDYSSISMDFAYMNRPVIYFQFDQDEFSKGHYQYSDDYFTHERDGFGPVVTNIDDLVANINKVIEMNFVMSDYYIDRVQHFFDLRDNDNSQRLYNILIGEKHD